jgi:hypothetical protein
MAYDWIDLGDNFITNVKYKKNIRTLNMLHVTRLLHVTNFS